MGSPDANQQGNVEENNGQQDYGSQDANPPPRPEPSKDTGIIPPIKSPHLQGLDHLTPETVDIFTLDAVAALKLLCRGAQFLVEATGKYLIV